MGFLPNNLLLLVQPVGLLRLEVLLERLNLREDEAINKYFGSAVKYKYVHDTLAYSYA